MFALPLAASLQSHVFGRFVAPSVSSPARAPIPTSVASTSVRHVATTDTNAVNEDEEIDLAQRVRNVGEW